MPSPFLFSKLVVSDYRLGGYMRFGIIEIKQSVLRDCGAVCQSDPFSESDDDASRRGG